MLAAGRFFANAAARQSCEMLMCKTLLRTISARYMHQQEIDHYEGQN